MARYLDVSGRIMRILGSFSPVLEQVSVDEAFLDVSGVLRRWKGPEPLARAIKERIRRETGLAASVGVATNKFLAKLASDLEKPDGLTVLPGDPGEIRRLLAPMPVERLWGVGKVTASHLHRAGFRTIGDVQQVSPGVLMPVVGAALADHLTRLACGVDTRVVVTETAAKSISAEHTFDDDVEDPDAVRRQLIELVEQVGRRLRDAGEAATTVVIKIRTGDFQTTTRQETWPRPVCSDRRLLEAAATLWSRHVPAKPVRLIGFGVSGFAAADGPVPQLDLFPDPERERDHRDARVDRAMDRIRERHGAEKIKRASSLDPAGEGG
jgi:DNA polymerase-4